MLGATSPTATATGARAGQQYLDSLRDEREVWVRGERVADVPDHPLFRGVARSVAHLYDLQQAPGTREVMTYPLPDGEQRASVSYLAPRTPEQLAQRRANTELWARESFGLLGRPPDFCASILVGLNAVPDLLAQAGPAFADHAAAYLDFARAHDLCLAHALHDPPLDKSLRPEQDPDRCVRILQERSDGLVVRGARTMSTFAPLANEILVYPAYPLNEREGEFSIFFAVAVATPGLKLVCREPFSTPDRDPFDHPAATRFDEPDALVIFDDVLVPWERVFAARAPAVTSQLLRGQAMAWAGFSSDLVLLEKMELLIGVCHLLATSAGIDSQPFVVEELGELITYKEMMRAAVRLEQVEGQLTPSGFFSPRRAPYLRSFVTSTAERLASLIEHIGTSSLIMTPSLADLRAPELRPFIERYFRGKHTSAEERIKLCKLAWDLSCDAFGGRQTLYERLHSGDPHGLMALTYRTYDLTHAVGQVRRLLSLAD